MTVNTDTSLICRWSVFSEDLNEHLYGVECSDDFVYYLPFDMIVKRDDFSGSQQQTFLLDVHSLMIAITVHAFAAYRSWTRPARTAS